MLKSLPPNVLLLIDIVVAWIAVGLLFVGMGALTGRLAGGVELLLLAVIAIVVVVFRHVRRIRSPRTPSTNEV